MTAHDTPNAAAHGDTHHGDDGASHGSRRDYMVGFVLSVILTAIPFWLVMSGTIENKQVTAFIVMAFALVQIVVHMVYFLHMNAKVESGWSMLALVFTAALVLIMLAGSIWVMYHMNTNMMPAHDAQSMRNMP